jgi:hypothetical protein
VAKKTDTDTLTLYLPLLLICSSPIDYQAGKTRGLRHAWLCDADDDHLDFLNTTPSTTTHGSGSGGGGGGATTTTFGGWKTQTPQAKKKKKMTTTTVTQVGKKTDAVEDEESVGKAEGDEAVVTEAEDARDGSHGVPAFVQWAPLLPSPALRGFKAWTHSILMDSANCFLALHGKHQQRQGRQGQQQPRRRGQEEQQEQEQQQQLPPRHSGGGVSGGGGAAAFKDVTQLQLQDVTHEGLLPVRKLVTSFLVYPNSATRRRVRALYQVPR